MSSKTPASKAVKPLRRWKKWCAQMVINGHNLLCLPITFDKGKGEFQITPYSSLLWFWYFRVVWSTLDNIYLLTQFSSVTPDATGGGEEFFQFSQHMVMRIVSTLMTLAMASDLGGVVALWNTLFKTEGMWKEKYGRWGNQFSGPLERRFTGVMRFVCPFVTVQGLMPLIPHLQHRESKLYWLGQYLTPEVYNSPIGIALGILSEIGLGTLSVICGGFAGTTVVANIMLFIVFLHDLRKTVATASDVERRTCFAPLLLQYRAILLLSRFVNTGVGGQLLSSGVFGATWSVVVLTTCVIRYGGQLSIAFTFNLIIAASLIGYGLRELLDGGGRVLRNSKQVKLLFAENHRPYAEKYLAASKDVRIYVGMWYFIDECSVLTSTEIILDQTIALFYSY